MHTLATIANLIDARLIGNPQLPINGIASLSVADNNQLSYIIDKQYKKQLQNSKAAAVIVSESLAKHCPANALVVADVHLAFATISHYFKKPNNPIHGIHSTAVINNAKISNGCVIGENTVLGQNCIIGANTVIEDNVSIGDNVLLHPNVTILQGCSVGNNVLISSGVVIGSNGFGNARDEQKHWHPIAHLGNVLIANNVTIGANSVIDRGTLEDTKILSGTCIDNLVHIAHNVIIHKDCAIAAAVTIGGSCILGARCMIGGGATIASHIHLAADVIVSGASTVDKHLPKRGHYTGFTSISKHQKWKKIQFLLLNFDKITRYLNLKLKDIKGAK